ncbi:MAG: thioredoxin fold domain-containing protein [Candidatus Sumerlaeaceae bacterium]|nr:thioredoxin fold domain-containing protein [Candidatus Sumerlaeaceae bacterium]
MSLICPKCDLFSENEAVCDHCGALINRIRERERDLEQQEMDAEPEWVEAGGSESGGARLFSRLMVLLLIAFLGFVVYSKTTGFSPGMGHGQSGDHAGQMTSSEFKAQVVDGKQPTMICFFATWCGPCKQYAPEFAKAASGNKTPVVFASMDVDQATDIARKYEIQSIPTTIYFRDGEEYRRFRGGMTAKALLDVVAEK